MIKPNNFAEDERIMAFISELAKALRRIKKIQKIKKHSRQKNYHNNKSKCSS